MKYLMKISFFLFAILSIGLIAFKKKQNDESKKYVVVFTLAQWQGKIDTLAKVNDIVGLSLTVDQANEAKKYVTGILEQFTAQVRSQVVADTAKKK